MNQRPPARSFLLIASLLPVVVPSHARAAAPVRLLTLDPGHFHAALVQKFMYAEVSPQVQVYAPEGPDLRDHLQRIEAFNRRPENPTYWQEQVYAGPDFLQKLVHDRAGNVVVVAGNNNRKTTYLATCVKAGFHVLADKPMAITPEGFGLLRKSFRIAARNKTILYDIMTERYDIHLILERELARMPELFGTLCAGTLELPAVEMESLHYFYKEVDGKPLLRPAWSFDVREQGEAIPDVGTHLVDLVQWESFPDQALDWRKDTHVLAASHWCTALTPSQFKLVTATEPYPDYLRKDVDARGELKVLANGRVDYTLRGVHARVTALWQFQAPAGGRDTMSAVLRGTRAELRLRQTAETGYAPVLSVVNRSSAPAAEFELTLRRCLQKLCLRWPGLELEHAGEAWQIRVPQPYKIGHEEQFALVTRHFLEFVNGRELPEWEVPNMLAKYYTTTEAWRLSRAADKNRP